MHAVVALALPAVEAFDLAIPSQVFGDQVIHAERYTFTVCAPSAGLVPSTAGYAIRADRGLDALADADTVVVPGYLPLDNPGEAVCSALRDAAARGARVVSVCTGAFALAAAGLLDHRRATTHWQYADDLSARFPAVKVDPDVLWVDEGAVLTSAGLAAGIDLCVQLVRADYGTDAAIRVARRMVVAPHRDGGQAQWLERPVPLPGHGLAPTCEWALERLEEPLTVADLARHAGWCRSRTSPAAAASAAPLTSASTWRATRGPPPPPTAPPTKATSRVRDDVTSISTSYRVTAIR
jgi:transcriptional regulator GlxA family with amidase domain